MQGVPFEYYRKIGGSSHKCTGRWEKPDGTEPTREEIEQEVDRLAYLGFRMTLERDGSSTLHFPERWVKTVPDFKT